MTTKGLLVAAIASVAVYELGDLASALLYDGYSYKDQWISELSAFGSPVRPLMVTAILAHGLLLLVFGVGTWQSADPSVSTTAADRKATLGRRTDEHRDVQRKWSWSGAAARTRGRRMNDGHR